MSNGLPAARVCQLTAIQEQHREAADVHEKPGAGAVIRTQHSGINV